MHIPTALILPGFYPDPTICRKGEDYYIASSTFGYFPGVPIHHSRDLKRWTFIGYALNRPSQLPLASAPVGIGGIYAPSLRYRDGRFWLITTNLSHTKHFIVHATDPAGPWSDPIRIDDAHQGGIDSDLFWDEDGRVHVCCTRRGAAPADPHNGIYRFEVDPLTGQGSGGRRFVWSGTGVTHLLSTTVAGGFTGVYLGLFAVDSQNGKGTPAAFCQFTYSSPSKS
jgi:alpha-N-arabinofuranosidase